MKRAGAVALNTFREAVRDRVLYNLVFFALLMMAAAIFVGQISIGIEEMVIKSLGLSAISVIGLLIAVFIGVGLVSILPTMEFLRWRKQTRAGAPPEIDDKKLKSLRMFLHLELMGIAVILACAAMMARGIGELH